VQNRRGPIVISFSDSLEAPLEIRSLAMKSLNRNFSNAVLALSQRVIRDVYFPRIARCLAALPAGDIWWRPNPACNGAGNLVLHLEGNLRQWIISGLGGAKDVRRRDLEFSECGPISRNALLSRLRRTVRESCVILRQLSPLDLRRAYVIQGFSVTGLQAVLHVTEHFSHHAGQIIYLAKLRTGRNLGFTRLPADSDRRKAADKGLKSLLNWSAAGISQIRVGPLV
jgi:uncharacterized damage-inducible protein DinB